MTQLADQTPNALSFDVEDYFQVSNFEHLVAFEDWPKWESRVERNTDHILELLDETDQKATFFVLGWVAETMPSIVRSIVENGHELGTHGYRHRLIYTLTPDEFREDLRRSVDILESQGVRRCSAIGRRRSRSRRSRSGPWRFSARRASRTTRASFRPASEVRDRRHSSSPVHDRLRTPRSAALGRAGRFGASCGGGWGLLSTLSVHLDLVGSETAQSRGAARRRLSPSVEFDPDQPRIRASLQARFRHYVNLSRTGPRLRRLIRDFRFGPVSDLLPAARLVTP